MRYFTNSTDEKDHTHRQKKSFLLHSQFLQRAIIILTAREALLYILSAQESAKAATLSL